ncbi:Small glutamine-rich tetratricopeptide repeat-containing protein alpha [Pteropus alecto]|uniref:Small glutamine-rich tetratricopeptide repeat-containing protein alpha n=1 Tax=Pteropus alecto TaxID=9402 RepID=L5KJ52_PTEAL|nr:Small glutamine-rich tetratricopeptide repeat-containing protein alpha [Pteropus alecto]
MKVENFEAAVHFYGKAIELNPANAVYFCNRYVPGPGPGPGRREMCALRDQYPRSHGCTWPAAARGQPELLETLR